MAWKRIVGMVALVSWLPLGAVAVEGDKTPVDKASIDKAPVKGTGGDRLKFRDGPPCTCANGLDEAAIREGAEKRQQDVPGDDGGKPRRSAGDR